MKKTISLILICLMLSMNAWHVMAQASDGETKPVGYRLSKTKEAITVYQDFMGQPNPYARFFLEGKYYFKLLNDTVTACSEDPRLKGKKFAKISLPGKEQQGKAHPAIPLELGGNISGDRVFRSAGDEFSPAQGCPRLPFEIVNTKQAGIPDSGLNMVYWVEVNDLYKNTGAEANYSADNLIDGEFVEANIRSRFFSSALVVPFKYRFSFKSSSSSFTGESSIGAALGWTFARDYDFDNRAWLMLSGGIASINPNTPFDDAGSEKEKNMLGATACLGIGINVGEAQAGLVLGFDFADPSWEFHAKPWVAFSVGYAFLRPKGNPSN